MNKTLVGYSDNRAEAESIVKELMSEGFGAGEVALLEDPESVERDSPLPPGEAHEYAEKVRRGGAMVTINTDEEKLPHAREIIERRHFTVPEGLGPSGEPVHQSISESQASTSQTQATGGGLGTNVQETRIPITEEKLQVGKHIAEEGGVRVHKHVVEEPVKETVKLRQEEATVERHAADRPVSAGDLEAFKEGTIEIKEKREEPMISKVARVVEEIVVGKKISEHEQVVEDTVRRVQVDIEQLNKEVREDPRYSGKSWSEVELEVRSRWENKNPGTWDRLSEHFRSWWNKE